MTDSTFALCISNDGIHAYIPNAAVTMMAFVEAYHRLNGDAHI